MQTYFEFNYGELTLAVIHFPVHCTIMENLQDTTFLFYFCQGENIYPLRSIKGSWTKSIQK